MTLSSLGRSCPKCDLPISGGGRKCTGNRTWSSAVCHATLGCNVAGKFCSCNSTCEGIFGTSGYKLCRRGPWELLEANCAFLLACWSGRTSCGYPLLTIHNLSQYIINTICRTKQIMQIELRTRVLFNTVLFTYGRVCPDVPEDYVLYPFFFAFLHIAVSAYAVMTRNAWILSSNACVAISMCCTCQLIRDNEKLWVRTDISAGAEDRAILVGDHKQLGPVVTEHNLCRAKLPRLSPLSRDIHWETITTIPDRPTCQCWRGWSLGVWCSAVCASVHLAYRGPTIVNGITARRALFHGMWEAIVVLISFPFESAPLLCFSQRQHFADDWVFLIGFIAGSDTSDSTRFTHCSEIMVHVRLRSVKLSVEANLTETCREEGSPDSIV